MNHARFSLAVAALLAVSGLAGPAVAQLSKEGTNNCRVGLTVKDRDGKTGTVESADGNSCYVVYPDGTKRYALQWMLTPVAGKTAPAKPATGGKIVPGNYQCYGGPAGNMRITLTGERWNDMYAKALPDGKVGLSSKPNTTLFYMTCERR